MTGNRGRDLVMWQPQWAEFDAGRRAAFVLWWCLEYLCLLAGWVFYCARVVWAGVSSVALLLCYMVTIPRSLIKGFREYPKFRAASKDAQTDMLKAAGVTPRVVTLASFLLYWCNSPSLLLGIVEDLFRAPQLRGLWSETLSGRIVKAPVDAANVFGGGNIAFLNKTGHALLVIFGVDRVVRVFRFDHCTPSSAFYREARFDLARMDMRQALLGVVETAVEFFKEHAEKPVVDLDAVDIDGDVE